MKQAARFNSLSIRDKALLIEEYGDFLMSIEYYDHRIFLYAMDAEYVEVLQNIENRKIEKIEVATYRDLDKYLSQVLIFDIRKKKVKGA